MFLQTRISVVKYYMFGLYLLTTFTMKKQRSLWPMFMSLNSKKTVS